MKKLITLTMIASIGAALALMAACQTVTTNDAELVASKKEFLLAQSGFRVITVTTPKATTGYQWTSSVHGLGSKIQRQIVLRVSHRDEGQDLCRKTKTIQRL